MFWENDSIRDLRIGVNYQWIPILLVVLTFLSAATCGWAEYFDHTGFAASQQNRNAAFIEAL
jgi:hypothetical protein